MTAAPFAKRAGSLIVGARVLITGGAGFIGAQLARSLLEHGAQVTLVDNFSRGRMDDDLRAVLESATLIDYDLTLPIQDDAIGAGYTHVYHLAAVVGVQQTNAAPHHVLRTNLLSTIHILDWCARNPPEALFFSSTSEVADGSVRAGIASIPAPESAPLTIDAPRQPRAAYATSKIAGELLCWNYARAYGFPACIARYHNVYGPRMGHEHVIPQLIERALQGCDPFVIYGSRQRRAFCYIDDAVDATLRLMALPFEGPQVVNIGNDEETQIADLATKILELVGFAPRLQSAPASPGSPDRRCPDLTLLRALTGYRPTIGLEAGLARTFEWYQMDWERRSTPRYAVGAS
jgi:UDP-glucose 4-epimerase/UDP-glucuronate decarboxylase